MTEAQSILNNKKRYEKQRESFFSMQFMKDHQIHLTQSLVIQNQIKLDVERNINPLVENSLLEGCELQTNYDDRSSVRNVWRDMSENDVLEQLKELEDE